MTIGGAVSFNEIVKQWEIRICETEESSSEVSSDSNQSSSCSSEAGEWARRLEETRESMAKHTQAVEEARVAASEGWAEAERRLEETREELAQLELVAKAAQEVAAEATEGRAEAEWRFEEAQVELACQKVHTPNYVHTISYVLHTTYYLPLTTYYLLYR